MFESLVFFIVCHAGPADHFAVFAEDLQAKGCNVEIYAGGPAIAKFASRPQLHVQPFSLEGRDEEELASEIAKKCVSAAVVITDVGHSFNISMQKRLAVMAPRAIRAAYYDNPGDSVPGYSETAAKVMQAAEKILFSNANHAEEPIYETPSKEIVLAKEKRVGIGYYPIEQAAAIAKLRKERGAKIRAKLFESHGLKDVGQKLLVYAGGNNEEYFSKAWPAFLLFLEETSLQEDLSNFVVLLQQHPGAKQGNRDGRLVAEYCQKPGKPLFLISSMSSDDAQAAADGMLYYQTSMASQFVLADIPTIQVGHAVFRDILTENKLCRTAINAGEFLGALKELNKKPSTPADRDLVKQKLGIRSDWSGRLADCIQEVLLNSRGR